MTVSGFGPRFRPVTDQVTRHRLFQPMDEREFFVTISQDEDGCFIAECPEVPGCVSQGRTKAEAMDNVCNAIRECLEVRREQGLPLTMGVERIEVTL